MPKGILRIPTNKIMFDDAYDVLDLTNGPNEEGWYHGHCPCAYHLDEHPSCAFKEADDGSLIVYCHTGCKPKDIYDAIRDSLNLEE